jgi:uncharacterized protein (TIGR00730 family)
MGRVCVFCGSSPGAEPDYAQAARHLGQMLAARHIGLVYGGSNVGLMGSVASAVLAAGGDVIGVIPRGLFDRQIAHTGLSDLRVVETMHERKALMAELADGFIALPGGYGTLEELFEVLTWGQLGLHQKPSGLLNVRGYFDQLVGFLNHLVDQQFLEVEHRSMLLIDDDPAALLDRFETYQPPTADKAAWALQLNNRQNPPR